MFCIVDAFETIKYERNNPKKFFENKSMMLYIVFLIV